MGKPLFDFSPYKNELYQIKDYLAPEMDALSFLRFWQGLTEDERMEFRNADLSN